MNIDFHEFKSELEEFITRRLKYKYQHHIGITFEKLLHNPDQCRIHALVKDRINATK